MDALNLPIPWSTTSVMFIFRKVRNITEIDHDLTIWTSYLFMCIFQDDRETSFPRKWLIHLETLYPNIHISDFLNATSLKLSLFAVENGV